MLIPFPFLCITILSSFAFAWRNRVSASEGKAMCLVQEKGRQGGAVMVQLKAPVSLLVSSGCLYLERSRSTRGASRYKEASHSALCSPPCALGGWRTLPGHCARVVQTEKWGSTKLLLRLLQKL